MYLRVLITLITLFYPLAIWLGYKHIKLQLLLPLQLYPVLISVIMLCLFAYSLIFPPSFIERIARLSESELPLQAVFYTRRVTQVWCVFFVFNGGVALATALWASPAVWSLYNGVISYLLMGLLFAGEYLVRLRFKQKYHV